MRDGPQPARFSFVYQKRNGRWLIVNTTPRVAAALISGCTAVIVVSGAFFTAA